VSTEDPIRFRDSGSSGPDELRSLFQAGTEDFPTDAELAALATKLGPVLAGGSVASAGMATKTKLGLAALGAAGAGVLAWALISRQTPVPGMPAVTAVPPGAVPSVTMPPGASVS